MTAKVIASGNQKGGSGKTSCSINMAVSTALGVYATQKRRAGRPKYSFGPGRRVLVVDLDRQQSAGDSLGVRGMPDGTSYAMALAGEDVDIDNCIRPAGFTPVRGSIDVMAVAPRDYELAASRIPLYENQGIGIISELLGLVADRYDYIFLDLRPELSHITASAFAASNGGVVVPVTSSVTTAIHCEDVFDHVRWSGQQVGRDIPLLGVIRNLWEAKSEEARDVDEFLAAIQAPVFNTTIPDHRVVSKSFALTTGPVVASYPNAPATKRFHELTSELMLKLEG